MAAWSFATLVLGALALGAPLAHALEMPVRRAYDPALYVMVTHTLSRSARSWPPRSSPR